MPRPASKYDALYEKYPFLSEVFMFECGNGWFDILSELCAKLDALKLGPDFKVIQIKEKLGILAFYLETWPQDRKPEIDQLIIEAERKSIKTCESCGRPGRRTSLGHGCCLVTFCKKCLKKANR
ncbi:MAG: hypothetical protein Q8L24_03055 [bacterium]|nr:hypothetical protein [bacterium]